MTLGMTILELPTVPSGQQTPARLVTLGDDTSEVSKRVPLNPNR